MWTHKNPYYKPELTLKSIEKDGEIHLFRSLNIKRVIGFIGSGISASAAMPTWGDLAWKIIEDTRAKLNEADGKADRDIFIKQRIARLGKELGKFENLSKEDIPAVLELCAQIRSDASLSALWEDRSIGTFVADKLSYSDSENWETLDAIYQDLGIRRFLTLNYDVLLEEYFYAIQTFDEPALAGSSDFKQLVEKPSKGPSDLHVVAYNRPGKSVVSTCMAPETIGDLIAFASFPFAHEAQIFHLHGRIDHPEKLILTEEDYQKLYITSNETRRTFNEALEMLFTGNDILFLGIGMQEDDPLRPLRQFALEERDRIWSARRIFALLPFEGEEASTAKAIKLKTRYDVHTIFFRGGNENDDLKNCTRDQLTGYLVAKMKSLAVEQKAWWSAWRAVPDQRFAIYRNFYEKSLSPEGSADQFELWSRHRTTFEHRVAPENPGESPFSNVMTDVFAYAVGLAEKKPLHCNTRGESLTWPGTIACKQGNRRILRFAASRGAGKGSFHLELQRYDVFSKLFQTDLDYAGAFFAHTSYSVEYLSVIDALIGFIALHIAKMEKRKRPHDYIRSPGNLEDDKGKPLWDETEQQPHRLDKLTKLLRLLADIYDGKFDRKRTIEKKRLFICLSGLDVLVNEYGDGYSPCIRAFFRLLTQESVDDEGRTPPLDIVLVAGRPRTPIRYLSDECSDGDENKQSDCADTARGRPHVGVDDAEASKLNKPRLVRWYRLKRLNFTDRYWLHKDSTGASSNGKIDKGNNKGNNKGNKSVTRWLEDELQKDCPALYNSLCRSVALDTWVTKCADAYYSRLKRSTKKLNPDDLKKELLDWFGLLDQTITRAGEQEVLGEIVRRYRRNNEIPLADENTFDRESETYELRVLIVRHLTLFGVPVTAEVIFSCDKIRRELKKVFEKQQDKDKKAKTDIEDYVLDLLVKRSMIIPVSSVRADVPPEQTPAAESGERSASEQSEREQRRYILHAQMREFLARQMGFAIRDQGERNSYEVTVYATQPHDLPTPNDRHFSFVSELIESQLEGCRDLLHPFYRCEDPKDPCDKYFEGIDYQPRTLLGISQKVRAVYSILRENFSLATLSRLDRIETGSLPVGEPFEIYRTWLTSLVNAALGVKTMADVLQPPPGGSANGNEQLQKLASNYRNYGYRIANPLYHFEIVWLLNERGVAAFVQGHLYDAAAILDQALRISRNYRISEQRDEVCRATERRIKLNRAILQIERANIGEAREKLEKLVRRLRDQNIRTPSVTYALAKGYLGLCSHLGGHFSHAEECYREIIDYVSETGNLRAASIFRRHYADLLRASGKIDPAREQLRLAILAASREEQKDVLYLALISQARIERSDSEHGNKSDAIRQLESAMEYAQKMGLTKIKVEALKVRAEINMIQGETEFAGRLAAQAIGLSTRHGMRLRGMSSLILYGQILASRGQTSLARNILQRTLGSAATYGYQTKAQQAQALLRSL